ncbi:MAG: hypothetical protein LBL92_03995 [Propionibacteriaceae bacterium]|nr:hypothetical protein [Propionibacteriaceae bacterium]
MVDWILNQPFIVAAVFLTLVAAVRSELTYALGRGVRAGAIRLAWATKLSQEASARATRWLDRWGWPIIPLSFLTVGFHTAVHITAGLIGWRWGRYTLAAFPGWILWGCLYAAGGLAVFAGLAALARRSPGLAVVVGLALIGVIVGVVVIVKRFRAQRQSPPALVVDEAP